MDSIKKYKIDHPNEFELRPEDKLQYIDAVLTYHSALSMRVPSEIANGMMNLFYAILYSNATTGDMENAVVNKCDDI